MIIIIYFTNVENIINDTERERERESIANNNVNVNCKDLLRLIKKKIINFKIKEKYCYQLNKILL